MDKFVVVIFPDETAAYAGTRALKELDAEGSLYLYGTTVIARDTAGKVSVKEDTDKGPLGTAVGALTGGLIGVLGGPLGAAVGVGGGALFGSVVDLYRLGVSDGFLEQVSGDLEPGRTAVIAEVDEDWVTPLDLRMEDLGGTVLRQYRMDVEDELHAKEVQGIKEELAQLKAEFTQAREESRSKLQARIDASKAKLQDAQSRAQAWADERHRETEAKVQALRQRAAEARAEGKAKADQRAAELRAEHERRSAKLAQARELVKEALAS